MGEHQVNLIQGAPLVQVHQRVADVLGAVQGGVLGGVHKLRVNGDVLLLKVVAAHLADEEQRGILLAGQVALRQLQHVVVVGAGQALVPCDDHKAGLALLLGLVVALDVAVLQLGGVAENIQDGFGQPVKIGLHFLQLLAGLFHLGGGDQIHGVGDFQRLLDAPHPAADLGYACHVALTCFL